MAIVEGNMLNPFTMGHGGPFGGGGGEGGLGHFGGSRLVAGARPFGGGSLGFPFNGIFPGLNITLPTINSSIPRFPFLGFPFL
jgi:hypothetical protein